MLLVTYIIRATTNKPFLSVTIYTIRTSENNLNNNIYKNYLEILGHHSQSNRLSSVMAVQVSQDVPTTQSIVSQYNNIHIFIYDNLLLTGVMM